MDNPVRTAQIELRKVGNDLLVHDVVHQKVHVLNWTAGQVLTLCDGEHSPAEIARSLSDATGIDVAIASDDVAAILRDFVFAQLLTK